MSKNDILKKQIITPNFRKEFYDTCKKDYSSSLMEEREVAKYGFSVKANDDEFEDKNVPLMQPTFFDENDPDNPKYVSLDEKKSELESKQQEINEIFSSLIYKFFNSCLISLIIVIPCYGAFLGKYINYITDFSFIPLILSTTCVVFLPGTIIGIKNYKKIKIIKKEINQLEQEIKEKEKQLEKVKKLQQKAKIEEIKNKLKSLTNDTKEILKDIINNKDLTNIIKNSKISYENLLELYEKTNAFEADNAIDEELEKLDIIGENNLNKNNAVKRKRYKIINKNNN